MTVPDDVRASSGLPNGAAGRHFGAFKRIETDRVTVNDFRPPGRPFPERSFVEARRNEMTIGARSPRANGSALDSSPYGMSAPANGR